mmetsp:Transcript_746/g.1602  ORF Transcript_746/g.1602 Transcript_746/m.1602 type:complete len:242 (-) Transcript_746:358-1083(-)
MPRVGATVMKPRRPLQNEISSSLWPGHAPAHMARRSNCSTTCGGATAILRPDSMATCAMPKRLLQSETSSKSKPRRTPTRMQRRASSLTTCGGVTHAWRLSYTTMRKVMRGVERTLTPRWHNAAMSSADLGRRKRSSRHNLLLPFRRGKSSSPPACGRLKRQSVAPPWSIFKCPNGPPNRSCRRGTWPSTRSGGLPNRSSRRGTSQWQRSAQRAGPPSASRMRWSRREAVGVPRRSPFQRR